MSDSDPTSGVAKKRWAELLMLWLFLAFITGIMLFMYSGAMAHGAKPAHPIPGHIGWVLAGLSPMIAYVGYRLLASHTKRKWAQLVCVLAAFGIFLLCQYLGVVLLIYALAGQPLHIG